MIIRYTRLFLSTLLASIALTAHASLFNDNEARTQIQQLETRLGIAEDRIEKMDAANKRQTNALLDLQATIDTQNAEIRNLRGQNEELRHNLQDAEKRQKDFYVDLDGRLRRFEAGDVPTINKVSGGGDSKADDPVTENRALEAAYGFYKAESYQNAVDAFREFLQNYPNSAHTANVRYWMGNAYFVLKDYKNSLASFKVLVDKYPTYPKIADAMFSIVDCYISLSDKNSAQLMLKQIMSKYPNSAAAAKAKKELAELK